jgi:hypothetical protein
MTRRNKQETAKKDWWTVGIIATAVVLIVVICAVVLIGSGVFSPDSNEPTYNINVQIEPVYEQAHQLGNGLELVSVGKFAGIYMEDGSNQIVSNTLMIKLANNSQKDLQFGKIVLEYPKFTAEFEATNIPAGRTVVLLEKNRREFVDERYNVATAQNLVFFSKNMTKAEDRIEISGRDGVLNVKNISAQSITGDIYVYYKYVAGDQLYGGVTYRAKISGGLDAGAMQQIMASHYDMDGSVILSVVIGE